MTRLLLLDDEEVIRKQLRRLLERNRYVVEEAATVEEALRLNLDGFDLIIADLRLPGAPGTDIIRQVEDVPVVIMTSYASVRSAVDSMRQGAFDYISKPFDHDELLLLIERALKQHKLLRQNAALKHDLERDYPVGGMVGNCKPMQTVFEHIKRVAPVDMTVLITGESGTGKELVARAVHEESGRCEGPLIAVNCAAIPEGLIESELFGHEKGAFTGAHDKREGMAEAANSGTLFLDEIGELPMPAQARLLRLLQDKEIRPVGSSYSRKVDIRLVAATNRDLQQQVKGGAFREDLYYRLKVMEISLPALRERGEDVTALAEYLLDKAAKELNRPRLAFSDAALAAIQQYRWPGNVRELQNAAERAAILCDGGEIEPVHLGIPDAGATPSTNASGTPGNAELSLDDYFRHFVISNQTSMTETELAQRLGISRKSLWERRQRMNLPRA
jgi:DNA-binding NtrC family response regulator